LLFHFPYQYEDRTRLVPLLQLKDKQVALVEATVIESRVVFKPRRRLELILSHQNARIHFMFFNWHPTLQKTYEAGVRVRAFGTARRFGSMLSMVHPEMQIMKAAEPLPIQENLTPIYHTVQGLSQRTLRQAVTAALNHIDEIDIEDLSPCDGEIDLKSALQLIHAPATHDNIDMLLARRHPAFTRLIEEELLAHQLSFLKLKQDLKQEPGVAFANDDQDCAKLQSRLGFVLTDAQSRVITEITEDLVKPVPMLRLVQGDVGSGKTAVAAFATQVALHNGYQVAIMAPTDLLAQQHYEKFSKWFAEDGRPNQVVLLSGKLRVKGCIAFHNEPRRLFASMFRFLQSGCKPNRPVRLLQHALASG